jgi:DNA-binding transcriptional regulator YiaG
MAAKKKAGKARGKSRKYQRRPIPERIAELEAQIEALKDLMKAREGFSKEKIRAERERLELTAADYAELVGVSMITVYAWENGRSRPRAQQLKRLNEVFGISKAKAWKQLGIEEVDTAGFSPQAIRAERKRLGLSAKHYADLMGVSMLSVYNWEKGRSFPREAQLERWKEVKGISRREAERRVGKS